MQTWFFIGSTNAEKVGYDKKTAPQDPKSSVRELTYQTGN